MLIVQYELEVKQGVVQWFIEYYLCITKSLQGVNASSLYRRVNSQRRRVTSLGFALVEYAFAVCESGFAGAECGFALTESDLQT